MCETPRIYRPDGYTVVLGLMCWGAVIGTSLALSSTTTQLHASIGSEKLLQVRPNHNETVSKWVKVVHEFLNSSGVTQEFLRDLHPCTRERNYNYDTFTPCVFFKLKMSGPTPQPYTSEGLPDSMPESLKSLIRAIEGRPQSSMVWLSCDGGSPADAENIGPVMYLPSRGFPAHRPHPRPTSKLPDNFSPVVAVMFEKPMKGIVINMVCKIWAKNLQGDTSINFELLVDVF